MEFLATVDFTPAAEEAASSAYLFATIAELDAADDSTMDDGTVAVVASLNAAWTLVRASTATADGITVLGASSGRWLRSQTPSRRFQLQPTWYVDALTGDDENDGSSALTALATQAEFVRRVGSMPAVAMTINMVSDSAEDMVWRNETSNLITVVGTPTTLYSGTAVNQTSWSSGSVRDGKITDTAIPVSWTDSGLIGKLGILTSTAQTGYGFWIWKDLAATLGTKTARYTRLGNDAGSVTHIATGAAFTIYELTKLTGAHIIDGLFRFEKIEFGTDAGDATQHQVNSGKPTFVYCKMFGMNFHGATETTMRVCWIAKGLDGGIHDNATIQTSGMHFADGLKIEHNGLLHAYSTTSAAKFVLDHNAHFRVWAGGTVGIWECANGIEMGPFTSIDARLARVWGKDVTGVGVTMAPQARIVLGNGYPLSIGSPATEVDFAGTAKLYSELPYVDATSGAAIVVAA